MLLLSDPYSFPTDAALALLCDAAPGVPILGGISSGRTPDGQGALFSGDEVREQRRRGRAAARDRDARVRVAGRCPARARGHDHRGRGQRDQRARRTAGARDRRAHHLRAVAARADVGRRRPADRDRDRWRQARLSSRATSWCGACSGADPDSGSLTVSASVRPGQVLRLHARDAQSADEDFRRALRLHVEAMGDRPPAGAMRVLLQRSRQLDVRRPRSRRGGRRTRVARGSRGGVLRGRRDRAGRRAKLPARLHRDASPCSRTDRRRPVREATGPTLPPVTSLSGNALVTGATGGIGQAIARALAARGATVDRDRSARRGARAAGERHLAAARSRATCRAGTRSTGSSRRWNEVDVLVANAALPGSGGCSPT